MGRKNQVAMVECVPIILVLGRQKQEGLGPGLAGSLA